MQKGFIGPYKHLWQLLEKIGRYNDAEAVLFQYRFENNRQGANELNAFYRRVTVHFPMMATGNYGQVCFCMHL